ncbi:MAG: CocE/NonD family hydrolase, partial [Candidatus Eremiobacteraeota bacterium]|nr:CocE/NonD family hydrolase [Candidatus Eremiobacteraeota bacterium]
MRDGKQLAVRLFGPDEAERPLPVIWTHYRYNAPTQNPAHLERWLARYPQLLRGVSAAVSTARAEPPDILALAPWLPAVVRAGYYAAVVDVRGTGASFGCWRGPFSPEEQGDAYEVTEWFAEQPWCDGNVGMFGRSYMGANQYLAAAARPPHLRAIFPEMAPFDTYALVHGNGVFREDFARAWSSDAHRRDSEDEPLAIDEDPGSRLLSAARAQHARNADVFAVFRDARLRDSIDPSTGAPVYETFNVAAHWKRSAGMTIPVCHLVGWYDMHPVDGFLYLHNAHGPFRLVIGPWAHTGTLGIDLAQEHIRWYDAHLKRHDGVGASREITYCVMASDNAFEWRSGNQADFEAATALELELVPALCETGLVGGALRPGGGEPERAALAYQIDPDASSGIATRWTNGYGGPFGYGDMRANDALAVTFTSAPLAEPLEIRGFARITLTVEAHDAPYLFVYLEDVHPDSWSQYITEGALALAHRAIGEAPYAIPDIPFHPGRAA